MARRATGSRALAGCVAAALVLANGGPAAAERPVVAVASSLRFVLPDIARAFSRATGSAVRLSFGSSGNLARQIRKGAPYELFLCADEAYVLGLSRAGLTEGRGAVYAVGRIALFAPEGSVLTVDPRMKGLGRLLAGGRIKRFAIANPELAPYGRAARQALRRAGLWAGLRGRLVYGENIAQAAQFAASGSAEGGIVAYALAVAPALGRRGRFVLIPAGWHAPIRQRMALLQGAGSTARRFYRFMLGPAARAILERGGFETEQRD